VKVRQTGRQVCQLESLQILCGTNRHAHMCARNDWFNPLNDELNPICHLLALLGVHPTLHVSKIWVKLLFAIKTDKIFSICAIHTLLAVNYLMCYWAPGHNCAQCVSKNIRGDDFLMFFFCFADHASRFNFCKQPTLRPILFSYIIPILYMFRAPLCSSSGELNVLILHLVYVTLCGWPSSVHVSTELQYC
jgi:hypothetical protein